MSSAVATPPTRIRHRFAHWHEVALVALLVALLVTARVLAPDFLAGDAQVELLTHIWEAALVAIPMTLVIVSGGIDLSVGSTMALCAVVLGLAYRAGCPIGVAALLAVGVGAACGAVNGWFVTRLRVHPLLVTLATLAAYRGVAEGISKGAPVSGFPEGFRSGFSGAIVGLSAPGLLCIIAGLLAAFVLARTTWGLYIYAIGNNESAARFSGIDVARLKLLLYTLSGLAAGLAAVLFVARRNTAKADVGTGLELEVITMVVLGGTSINGGRGTLLGTALGILLLHEVREFVSWHWQRDELNLLVVGLLLIGSVLLNRLLAPRGRGEAGSEH